jgi:carboxymethylenebutenolidase
LKKHLDGPWFDLEAVWEEHCRFEFAERDVARTMDTMVAQPYVNHIPTMTYVCPLSPLSHEFQGEDILTHLCSGGIGKDKLTSFYTHHFIFSNPPDTSLSLVSRTVGTDRVVDEFVFSLTHSQEVPWLIPGIPPTGKKLEIPFTSIVGMRGDRLCHEHISWDQATVLKQLGLLPEYVAFPYQIDGKAPEKGKRYEVPLPVVGAEASRKLVDEGCGESNVLMERKWRTVDDA